jgi:hypothetical protein
MRAIPAVSGRWYRSSFEINIVDDFRDGSKGGMFLFKTVSGDQYFEGA